MGMFGKSSSETLDVDHKVSTMGADTSNGRVSEEEDWLVVKPSADTEDGKGVVVEVVKNNFSVAKEKSVDARETPKEEIVVAKSVDGERTPTMEMEETDSAIQTPEPVLQFSLNLLEQIRRTGDFDPVADALAEAYYQVKRNLKLFVVAFVLSVLVHEMSRGGGNSQPKSIPSPKRKLNTTHTPEYSNVLHSLQARVQELEAAKRTYASEISVVLMERNHWRSMAVGCDRDLREIAAAHDKLEDSVKQSKWLAPVAFVSPTTVPRQNVTDVPKSAPMTTTGNLAVPYRPFNALVVAPSVAITVV